jgi:regulator of sigma E protease
VPKSALTTEIGEVPERIENYRGEMVPAPAHEAGLRPGDEILAVNDKPVGNWSEIVEFIILLTKRTEERKPVVNFTIARNGETKEISVEPILATNEKIRRVGIAPKGYPPLVAQVSQGMPAAEAGIRPGDKIVGINGREVSSYRDISNLPEDERGELVTLTVERTTEAGETVRKQFEMKPRMPEGASDFARDNQRPILGITMRLQTERVRLNPVEQTWERMETIYRTLYALVAGELRLRNMSGPVGIIDALQQSARSGIETLLWITLFININLAILNILPIPVLDGGHMLFATVTKIRGKPLPQNFIEATHAAFLILLLTAVVYITFFDIQRQIDRHTPVESPASATSTAEQPTGADEKTEGGRQDESASEQAPPNEGDASS